MRGLLILLGCWLFGSAALAQQTDLVMPEIPKLSVAFEPAEVVTKGGYVQGQILVKVQVASKHAFEKLHLDLPEIAGAEVIQVVRPHTRQVRSYGGEGFVFETALAIFPQNSGTLVLPSIAVSGAVEPVPGSEQTFFDRSATLQLEIAGIPPDFDDPWWLVSKRVILRESWSKPIEELRVGDIVRREITAVAFGVTAAQLPRLEPGRARGLSVVDAGGSATTERAPDGVVATVRRAWDFKIEAGGVAYISPVGITYWHPEERAERTVGLSGKRIEPLPPDRQALAAALLLEAQQDRGKLRAMAAALLLLGAIPMMIVGFFLAFLAWPTRADRILSSACAKAAAPMEVYGAVSAWAAASDVDLQRQAPGSVTNYEQLLREVYSVSGVRADRTGLVGELTRLSRRKRLHRARAVRGRLVPWLLGPRFQLDVPSR